MIFTRLNMKVTYDYWTDDARAIQKIVDGEADAYISEHRQDFWTSARRQERGSKAALGADSVRSSAAGPICALNTVR